MLNFALGASLLLHEFGMIGNQSLYLNVTNHHQNDNSNFNIVYLLKSLKIKNATKAQRHQISPGTSLLSEI